MDRIIRWFLFQFAAVSCILLFLLSGFSAVKQLATIFQSFLPGHAFDTFLLHPYAQIILPLLIKDAGDKWNGRISSGVFYLHICDFPCKHYNVYDPSTISCGVLPNGLFVILDSAADCSCLHVMTCTHPYWTVPRASHLFTNIALSSILSSSALMVSCPPCQEIPFCFLSQLCCIVRHPKQTPAENHLMHFSAVAVNHW